MANNIKMDLIFADKSSEGKKWIYLVQDREKWMVFLITVTNLLIP
jgi:hypothetical protein